MTFLYFCNKTSWYDTIVSLGGVCTLGMLYGYVEVVDLSETCAELSLLVSCIIRPFLISVVVITMMNHYQWRL